MDVRVPRHGDGRDRPADYAAALRIDASQENGAHRGDGADCIDETGECDRDVEIARPPSPARGALRVVDDPPLALEHLRVNQARRGPTAVPIPGGAGGLRGDGIAVCHQLITLDRAKLTRRLGALPVDVLAAVEAGIKAALDLS